MEIFNFFLVATQRPIRIFFSFCIYHSLSVLYIYSVVLDVCCLCLLCTLNWLLSKLLLLLFCVVERMYCVCYFCLFPSCRSLNTSDWHLFNGVLYYCCNIYVCVLITRCIEGARCVCLRRYDEIHWCTVQLNVIILMLHNNIRWMTQSFCFYSPLVLPCFFAFLFCWFHCHLVSVRNKFNRRFVKKCSKQ